MSGTPTKSDTYWRDAFWRKHDDELRGYSTARITQASAAERLGIDITCVETRARKLNLKWLRVIAAPRVPRKPKPLTQSVEKPEDSEEPKEPDKPKAKQPGERKRKPSQIEKSERKRIWDFPSSGRCVFPVGDPGVSGFSFCADDVADGRAYCPAHRRLCYLTPYKKTGVIGDVAGD